MNSESQTIRVRWEDGTLLFCKRCDRDRPMRKVSRGHIACPDGHKQSILTAMVAYAYDRDDYGAERLVLRPENYPPGYAQRVAAKRAAAERAMADVNRIEATGHQRGQQPPWVKNQLREGGALGYDD